MQDAHRTKLHSNRTRKSHKRVNMFSERTDVEFQTSDDQIEKYLSPKNSQEIGWHAGE